MIFNALPTQIILWFYDPSCVSLSTDVLWMLAIAEHLFERNCPGNQHCIHSFSSGRSGGLAGRKLLLLSPGPPKAKFSDQEAPMVGLDEGDSSRSQCTGEGPHRVPQGFVPLLTCVPCACYGNSHPQKRGYQSICFSFLQFALVCDRKDLNDIAQAIYMVGLLLGSMIFGPLSDRIGRRPVILISVFLQGLFGLGIAFVPHFYVYMAFRCVVGASVSGITMTILALATEWIGVSSRPKAVLTSHCCFAIGQMILAGLSYGIRNWRLLEIAGSAPIFAFFLFIGVLPESARWLVTKGRIEEAKKVLQKAAAINKRSLPPELLEQLKPEKEVKSGSFLDIFQKKHLRKVTLIMSCAWFVNSFVYYGLSLNVTNFGLDIYLTQLAFGAVEIPARVGCIFILQRFGRRKTQAVLLVLSGLVCLIITGIPEDQPVATTVLATIGKFAASASFSTSYVYAAELFPTVVRQTGVGLCSMAARVAAILAPLVRLLGQHHRAIPMAIFGSAPVLGGLLCVLLPETRGTDLADGTGDGHPPAEVCENATSSSQNGEVKGKGGGQDNESTKTTHL
ncbi:solute carrier family 22 member 13-like isoform X1 [Cyanistes caeruleus]|uniref:Solute carrier family 22 member 13-like n=2 Tax=Paridae TaxID=9153 RepID=A0A8C0UD43_CYACU|nr:solute carrier family 22 member 13-like isoform X1 [Cyanistes caeruleus]